MRVQAYSAYAGTLQVTVATPRPDAAPSTHFTAASVHEDYCASVRALLREYKHVGESSVEFPAEQRIQSFFPTFTIGGIAKPLFALRELMPIGSPRDIDADFQLEVMRIRYQFHIVILPAAFAANSVDAEAIERHVEYAIRQLFQANTVPDVFIPGDSEDRPHRSEIDIVCELGTATAKMGVDIPSPS